jgi:uncharacterized repeat protein (TIGR01451 family)
MSVEIHHHQHHHGPQSEPSPGILKAITEPIQVAVLKRDRKRRTLWIGALVLLVVFFFLGVVAARAATPPAGSTIGNQASATYTDSSNTPRTATSNVTLTVIQQIASLTLTSDQTRAAAPGGQVSFPHTLTNTGNGADTFALSLAQLGGDNFDLSGMAIYADANGDGQPDNTAAITSTGLLAAGAKFQFVVVSTVPGGQTAGQTSQFTVNAASTYNPARTAANTDTVTVNNNAVVRITKAISTNSGASPSGPYTYTLTFSNTGNATATAMTLADVVPAGMTYVTGSGRWSVSGTTALTDTAGGDPTGIDYDYGVTQAGRVTATVASLAPGQSGTLTFQVNVATGVAPGTIANTATFTYNDGATVVGPFTTNSALFTVTQPAAVTITGATVASAPQGSTVSFTNVVKNTGFGPETFEMTTSGSTFPAGTSFQLMQADGATPLLDSNGNGKPDTGPLAPGASVNIILRATLPTSATGGPYSVNKTATAASDATISATTTDTLTVITASTVDLTNDAAGTLGAGTGPETNAVTTKAGDPGVTVRFTLNAKNNSTVADAYDLAASGTADFAAALPTGWAVVFRDSAEAVISRTAVINAGTNQVFYADVTIPAAQTPGTQAVYFRVLSPTTGSSDRKHDAVTTNTIRRLSLTPNHAGQVFPGGSIVYSHTLTNNGNVLEGDSLASTIALATSDSLSGWSSVVYFDANGNGTLDASETQVTNTSFASNGAAGLAPGESVKLLVKIFAPAGAPLGAADTTTLTATTSNGTAITAAPAAVSATDASTIILSDLKLVKEQALDANGDGTADTSHSTAQITTGATPNASIRYRVTVTNTGSQDALSVVVSDATPAYTTYDATVPATSTVGTVGSTPANGASGSFSFNVGTLTPGQSAIITFGVKINP